MTRPRKRKIDPESRKGGGAAESFAFNLRLRRKQADVDPFQLAVFADTTATKITNIEDGVLVPDLILAARIARTLDNLCGLASQTDAESLGRFLQYG